MYKENEKLKELVVKKINENRVKLGKFIAFKTREEPSSIDREIEEVIEKIGKYLEIEMEYKIFKEDSKNYAYIVYSLGDKIDDLRENPSSDDNEKNRALIIDELSLLAFDTIKEHAIEEIERQTDLEVISEIYPGEEIFPLTNRKLILGEMDNITNINLNNDYEFTPMKSLALKVNLRERKKSYSKCHGCPNPCQIDTQCLRA